MNSSLEATIIRNSPKCRNTAFFLHNMNFGDGLLILMFGLPVSLISWLLLRSLVVESSFAKPTDEETTTINEDAEIERSAIPIYSAFINNQPPPYQASLTPTPDPIPPYDDPAAGSTEPSVTPRPAKDDVNTSKSSSATLFVLGTPLLIVLAMFELLSALAIQEATYCELPSFALGHTGIAIWWTLFSLWGLLSLLGFFYWIFLLRNLAPKSLTLNKDIWTDTLPSAIGVLFTSPVIIVGLVLFVVYKYMIEVCFRAAVRGVEWCQEKCAGGMELVPQTELEEGVRQRWEAEVSVDGGEQEERLLSCESEGAALGKSGAS